MVEEELVEKAVSQDRRVENDQCLLNEGVSWCAVSATVST